MTEEFDIVVAGYGAAGAAAALRAAELGASVLVLEKQPESGHTPSTSLSGGVIMSVNDADEATEYLDRCAGELVPRAVSRAWAMKAGTVVEWLQGVCPDIRLVKLGNGEHGEFPGAQAVECYWDEETAEGATINRSSTLSTGQAATGWIDAKRGPRMGGGAKLFRNLSGAIAAREPKIEVRHATPVQRLTQHDGTVTGVRLADGRTVRARLGVVLATGGYGYDTTLVRNYLRGYPVYFYGNPGNSGDGVRLAQDVGADLWHMNQMIGRGIARFEDAHGAAYNFSISINPPGYVIVDRNGRRFTNEYAQALSRHDFYLSMLDYDVDAGEYPRIPSIWLFDQRRFAARPIAGRGVGTDGTYHWSADNEREVERGWVQRADTIEDVARACGVTDPEAAAETVRRYNAACATQNDEFGRPGDSLVPLDEPPYYGVPLYPGGSNTCGGPRRDAHARVVNPFGEPIPGLYAAGELGEAVGMLYPADGANLSDCLCFGQLAAETAISGVTA